MLAGGSSDFRPRVIRRSRRQEPKIGPRSQLIFIPPTCSHHNAARSSRAGCEPCVPLLREFCAIRALDNALRGDRATQTRPGSGWTCRAERRRRDDQPPVAALDVRRDAVGDVLQVPRLQLPASREPPAKVCGVMPGIVPAVCLLARRIAATVLDSSSARESVSRRWAPRVRPIPFP
jgi:hypothetical protein